MAKIYTKTGDKGQTALVNGQRVDKNHLRVETYGQLDELNSHIGMASTHLNDIKEAQKKIQLSQHLHRIQNELFNLGSLLACADESFLTQLPELNKKHVQLLESAIDEFDQELPPLKSFILPGGSALASQLHICRTVCRKAERTCITLATKHSVDEIHIQYLNRLSDFLFITARIANHWLEQKDIPWSKS